MKWRFGVFCPILLVGAAAQNPPGTPWQELMSRAQAGDAAAQVQVGRAYEDGTGVPQNDETAVEWLRKSAEQGNPEGQNNLGAMYAMGRGVMRDRQEAVRWYRKAAKQGLPEGAYNVAISYYNGEGAPYDLDLAYAWMTIAGKRGDVQATEELNRIGGELNGHLDSSQLKLANIYNKGEEVPLDYAAAYALYTQLANLKTPQSPFVTQAQYQLCQGYATGRGVTEDLALARSWCRKAAQRGATGAYVVLGRMAEKGLGGDKNLKEAADWYRDAALERNPDGFLELGRLKSLGGSRDDQKEAYFWLYLGLRIFAKAADFIAPAQQAAARLGDKEISDQQIKAAAWLRMTSQERAAQKRLH
ncbi:MAG TPA: tetratricopeptide repeat protein [Terriglobales bacterium]